MMDLGPGIILTTLFISTAFTLYFLIRASHLESMAKIERGLVGSKMKNNNKDKYFGIKLGMLMMGIGAGMLLSFLFEKIFNMKGEILHPAFMLIFGGGSLVISYIVVNQLEERQS